MLETPPNQSAIDRSVDKYYRLQFALGWLRDALRDRMEISIGVSAGFDQVDV